MLYLSIMTVTRCGAGGPPKSRPSAMPSRQKLISQLVYTCMYSTMRNPAKPWVGSLPLAVDLRSQKEQGGRGLCPPVRCRGPCRMEKRL